MIVYGKDRKTVLAEPGVTRKVLAYNEQVMMCEISFKEGAKGSAHAHPHTQVSYVKKGSFRFALGDEVSMVSEGDSILIPPDITHSAEALEDAVLVDVFLPMRRDFVQ